MHDAARGLGPIAPRLTAARRDCPDIRHFFYLPTPLVACGLPGEEFCPELVKHARGERNLESFHAAPLLASPAE
jgi:hypothetical protein